MEWNTRKLCECRVDDALFGIRKEYGEESVLYNSSDPGYVTSIHPPASSTHSSL